MGKEVLPPGFRFHPTDIELIMYYLKRKVMGRKLNFEVISELDIYKVNPWDLPGKSCLRTGDLKWYFFSPREKKYVRGSRMSRTTDFGYWKTTGKDRSVHYKGRVVGLIKTLVFHIGRAPKGDRTDWVMHEYRLDDKNLADSGIVQDTFVLCEVFQKSGPGPRNGAQYGAPFDEEEWNEDLEIQDGAGVQISSDRQICPITTGCLPNGVCPGSSFEPGQLNSPEMNVASSGSQFQNIATATATSIPVELSPEAGQLMTHGGNVLEACSDCTGLSNAEDDDEVLALLAGFAEEDIFTPMEKALSENILFTEDGNFLQLTDLDPAWDSRT